MTCVCFEGYTGNGLVSCDKISKLKIYFLLKLIRKANLILQYF